jgi:peptide/nickel transport system substrate-binding protein
MGAQSTIRRVIAGGALFAAGAMVLAACGSSTAAPATTTTKAKKAPVSSVVKGGTVTYAEQPATPPNYIFPFQNLTYFSVANDEQFEYLMYRPLYWFGSGADPTLNLSLSVGKAPIFTDGDTKIVLNLNPYKWSDGESVNASDVIFWMNMLKAEQANWAAFVPGAFPDNVTNVVATGKEQVTFTLNKAYSPTWFTYNELSQITPMPAAWDVTSTTGAPGSGGCASVAYSAITVNAKYAPVSPAAKTCAKVYDFLSIQSGYNPTNPSASDASALTTYATSPIWDVVDGPWHLVSFSSTGKAVFDPNPNYSGPVKPTIAQFIELPFTSDTAEYNALVAGAVDVGYLPFSEITADAPSPGAAGPNNASLAAKYNIETGFEWSVNYFPENYNSTGDGGNAGPIFRQLYFRQAFQSLIDQPAYLKKIDKNYGVPTYGPVPVEPPTWASPAESANPYPYDPAKAISLLKSHGWKVVPGGISTCVKPGTAPDECGAGIAKGAEMNFNLQFVSGTASIVELMSDEAAAWDEAGIKINLSEAGFNTIIANASPTSKSWEMENWGAGWIYAPDYYPTGGEIFATGAGSNSGSYDNTENNTLIAETHTSPSKSVFYEYQDYLAKQLPVVWQPNPLVADEVVKNLVIGPLDPLEGITPETWTFMKS